MDRNRLLSFVLLVCCCSLFSFAGARELRFEHKAVYNHTVATILVEYASAVYVSDLTDLFSWKCSRCDGVIEGFEILELVVDVQHCLQAFVGVDKGLHAIVIAFRGTQEHSIQNWIEDLYWKQLDISYPGMPNAMVHHGFYFAYHNTTMRLGILNAIKTAKEIYGEMKIIVTGHSMGGAMASLCGLDLAVNHDANEVQVITFGQPRIGNAAFASYYSQLVPNMIRVTNNHDIVPHLPPYYTHFPQKTYHHFPREVILAPGSKYFLISLKWHTFKWIYKNRTQCNPRLCFLLLWLTCDLELEVSIINISNLYHYTSCIITQSLGGVGLKLMGSNYL
ncbi:hypothetical protein QQ045_014874 [Rhodiola kirilowii]